MYPTFGFVEVILHYDNNLMYNIDKTLTNK